MKRYIQTGIALMMLLTIMTPIHEVHAQEAATDEKYFTFDRDYGRITNYNLDDDPNAPTEVIIPETIKGERVRELGYGSFENKAVTKVVIANSVTAVKQPFNDCANLTTIILGTGTAKLDFMIGSYLDSLTTFTIPGTVKSLSNTMPFVGCDNLTELIFEEGFQSIDTPNIDGFGNMAVLSRIELPSTMTSINETAFASSNGITEIIVHQQKDTSALASTAPWGAKKATVTWDEASGPVSGSSEVKVSYDSSNKIVDPEHPTEAKWSVVIPKEIAFSSAPNGKTMKADITLKSENSGELPTGSSFINVSVASQNGFALTYDNERILYTMDYDDKGEISGTLNEKTGTNKEQIGAIQQDRDTIGVIAQIVGNATKSATYTDTLIFTIENVMNP